LLSFAPQLVFAYATKITVAKDGSGDFRSIQAAINDTKAFPDSDITLFIKNGIYEEKVDVFAWNTRVTLLGESRNKTIIRFGDHFDKINMGRNSTFHTYTLRIAGNDFRAANLTVENTSGPVGQAVALHVEADRAAFYNVALKGYQDTLYLAGEGHRSYFQNCLIEGSVDFIFGEGTAWFENCEVRSLRGESYVTAASTPAHQTFGFVFNQCEFSAASDVQSVFLGRPWRGFARTLIMNSKIGPHIDPAGWQGWDGRGEQGNVVYVEANNTGLGSNTDARTRWSTVLITDEVATISPTKVLQGWIPVAP